MNFWHFLDLKVRPYRHCRPRLTLASMFILGGSSRRLCSLQCIAILSRAPLSSSVVPLARLYPQDLFFGFLNPTPTPTLPLSLSLFQSDTHIDVCLSLAVFVAIATGFLSVLSRIPTERSAIYVNLYRESEIEQVKQLTTNRRRIKHRSLLILSTTHWCLPVPTTPAKTRFICALLPGRGSEAPTIITLSSSSLPTSVRRFGVTSTISRTHREDWASSCALNDAMSLLGNIESAPVL